VLAFGLGVLLGLVFERRVVEEVATEPAWEPVTHHLPAEPETIERSPGSVDDVSDGRTRELVHH